MRSISKRLFALVTQHLATNLTPGQAVRSVFADADNRSITRVPLPLGDIQSYETNWYRHAAIRTVESMLVGSERPTVEIRQSVVRMVGADEHAAVARRGVCRVERVERREIVIIQVCCRREQQFLFLR